MKAIAIIPAYNEEKTIAEVVSKTKKYIANVIVVDDGSIDSTAQRAIDAGAEVQRHVVNMGKGFALKTGFKKAIENSANIIITMDADGQHNPKDILKLIEQLRDVDVVLGIRETSGASPVFKFGNRFLNKMFKVLFKLDVMDTQSGFRAFNKRAFESIKWKSNGYAVETEMLAQIKKNNLAYKEVMISTKYHNIYKGTTILDGIRIAFKMLIWKLGE